MIRTLHKKFIAASMQSFLIVLIAALIGINLANLFVVIKRMNNELLYLAQNDVGPSSGISRCGPVEGRQSDDNPEYDIYMEIRYFIVTGDRSEPYRADWMSMIASIAGQDAQSYLNQILDSGKSFGYCGDFRYYAQNLGEGDYKFIFLYSFDEIASVRSLLAISVGIGLLCCVAVFVLSVMLSQKAVAPIVESYARQKQFITDASHEIHTPLGIIAVDIDMLALEYGENEWSESARNQTDRLAGLIDSLVTLSRLDEETVLPEAVTVDLSGVVCEMLMALEPQARAKRITIESDLMPELTVKGDAGDIQRLVSILLENAVKYVPDGGKVQVRLFSQRKSITLEIYNTCVGLDISKLDRLFDRFYRADVSRSEKKGYGIGLSIARSIIERYGGQLSVRSEDGASIVFTATL